MPTYGRGATFRYYLPLGSPYSCASCPCFIPKFSNQELNERLCAIRGDVAVKSKKYEAARQGLDDVLKALKDPTKNAVALSEAAGNKIVIMCAGS
jgi:hypothetical protein